MCASADKPFDMGAENRPEIVVEGGIPAQRKTTLKWDANGELTAIDVSENAVGDPEPPFKRLDNGPENVRNDPNGTKLGRLSAPVEEDARKRHGLDIEKGDVAYSRPTFGPRHDGARRERR